MSSLLTSLNPFIVHRPLAAEEMVPRSVESRQLLELAAGGQASRISAPRRYGKTSLLNQAIAEADDIGLGTVYIDFTGVVDVVDAAARIEAGYRGSLGGRLSRRVVEVTDALDTSVGLKLGPVTLSSHQRDMSSDLRRMYRLLDLPERIFQRTGHRCVVIFDEFQDLMRAEGQVDGAIRSRIQHHRDSASYVFAGSHPGMMAGLFGHRERPLYGQARPVVLGRLPEAQLVSYVEERLGTAEEDAHHNVIEQLVELAAGHPQRTLLLAHYLYERLRLGSARPTALLIDVVQAALRDVDDGFRLFWDEASPDQQELILALAEDGSLPAAHVASSDTRSSAERALAALGDILREGDEVSLSDPLLGLWVRDRVARPPVARRPTPSRPLRVGDEVFHKGLGPGHVIDIDPGEGFGEQREYVTCEWRNGVRSLVPRELLTASPVRQLSLEPGDIDLIQAQLSSPYEFVVSPAERGSLSEPLRDLHRLAEIVCGLLYEEPLDGALKRELDGLVALLSAELAVALKISVSSARQQLYKLTVAGATSAVRADAGEFTKEGARASAILLELTRDDNVWFPHAAWKRFQRASAKGPRVVDLGLLIPSADDREGERFLAIEITGIYWLIARRKQETRVVGLFESEQDAREHVGALRGLQAMTAHLESGKPWIFG